MHSTTYSSSVGRPPPPLQLGPQARTPRRLGAAARAGVFRCRTETGGRVVAGVLLLGSILSPSSPSDASDGTAASAASRAHLLLAQDVHLLHPAPHQPPASPPRATARRSPSTCPTLAHASVTGAWALPRRLGRLDPGPGHLCGRRGGRGRSCASCEGRRRLLTLAAYASLTCLCFLRLDLIGDASPSQSPRHVGGMWPARPVEAFVSFMAFVAFVFVTFLAS